MVCVCEREIETERERERREFVLSARLDDDDDDDDDGYFSRPRCSGNEFGRILIDTSILRKSQEIHLYLKSQRLYLGSLLII